MARKRGIGRNGSLPWPLPNDLKRFRHITWGKPVVMGRKTHESIGRPLPGRHNIVVSHNRNYAATGCSVVDSLPAAFELDPASEIMVIGGASIYQEALLYADRVYLTEVQADIDGDVRFPALDTDDWRELEREDHLSDPEHAYPFSFVLLERVRR